MLGGCEGAFATLAPLGLMPLGIDASGRQMPGPPSTKCSDAGGVDQAVEPVNITFVSYNFGHMHVCTFGLHSYLAHLQETAVHGHQPVLSSVCAAVEEGVGPLLVPGETQEEE